MSDENVSRRGVLRGVAAGAAATGMAGEVLANESEDVIGHVVGLKAGASPEIAKREAQSVRHELDFGGLGSAVAGKFSTQALDGLRNNPNVAYVEADSRKYHALAQTLPWGVDRVDADVLHSNGETGNGADIAILDTGIDSDHPDLQANLAGGKCLATDCCGEASGGGGPFGCSTNDNTCNYAWDDDNDHGTHCAGIANAVDNSEGVVGVSTDANLWAGKVLDGCGSGYLSDIAAGIEWAADQGFDVASMSLGADSGDDTLQNACQYAQDKGVLLVAAAGNSGPCTDCVGYPAAYDSVVAVSSTNDSDDLSDFSSQGPEIEIAAPGTDVYSTIAGGYDTFSGTSMACPHVSGAAGQLMANGYSNSDARSQLKSTAEDIGLGDNEQGAGLLDAAAALGYDDGDGGDDDDGGDGGDNAPVIDSFSVSTGSTGPWTRVTSDWAVSDTDGDLSSVTTELLDGSGNVLDSTSTSVSGSSASGSHEDKTKSTPSEVVLTVTDANGNSASSTKSV